MNEFNNYLRRLSPEDYKRVDKALKAEWWDGVIAGATHTFAFLTIALMVLFVYFFMS